MILLLDWYFLNRIVSICASFHSIYIQWTQPDISITSSYFVICWLALSHLNKALLWLCPLVRFMIYNALCTFRWGSVEDELFTPCTRRSQGWKTYNQTLNFHLSWWGFPSRFLVIGGECKPDSRFDNVGHNTTLMHLIKAEPVMATGLTVTACQ